MLWSDCLDIVVNGEGKSHLYKCLDHDNSLVLSQIILKISHDMVHTCFVVFEKLLTFII